MNKKIINFFREDINSLSEYEVLDSKNMIKLDAMENPYDIEVKLEMDINQNWQENVNLNRYPDADCQNLKKNLLKNYSLNEDYDFIVGNGSDELIQIIFHAFLKPENIVLLPKPSFSMYKKIAQVVGLRFEEVLLKDNFALDINLMLKKIEELNPALIFLAYPNNPTGNLWDKEDIKKILLKANGLVIIDEAYEAFSGKSFIDQLKDFDNLLIMRTLSKIGFAGIRLGYLFGQKYIIRELNKLRLPFNINSVSQKMSHIYFKNNSFFSAQAEEIIKNRDYLQDEMTKIEHIKVYKSKTNFILFKVLKNSADQIFNDVLSDKILIKNMTETPGLENCLRVTVGTREECDLFIQSLKNSLI
jgi:histidinol-phosphate aminotransferase